MMGAHNVEQYWCLADDSALFVSEKWEKKNLAH